MPIKLPLEEKLENAEQLVAFCLKNFPETRGDDRALWIKVAELQGFRFPKKLIPLFYKILSFETVRRTRQKLNSEGLFLPDSQRVAERSLFCMESREFYRRKNGK